MKLIVEGKDDEHVVRAIKARYVIPVDQFEIIDCQGIENLLEKIPVFHKDESNTVLGILVDADIDLNARWVVLRNIFAKLDYQLPNELPQDGLIIEGEKRIGIWIMPNNIVNGMLEDFISFLIPEADLLKPIAETTLSSIEAQGINKYNSTVHHSKALIHTWLAWQDPPGRPFGQAITNKSLSTEKDICDKFANWLKTLFLE